MPKTGSFKIGYFKYPASDNIKSRTSTLARAMACTLTLREPCSLEEREKWEEIFGKENVKCAYCGNKATHLDHLHPLIKKYISYRLLHRAWQFGPML